MEADRDFFHQVKRRGQLSDSESRGVTLEEIPGLVDMQSHCAGAGLTLSPLYFSTLYFFCLKGTHKLGDAYNGEMVAIFFFIGITFLSTMWMFGIRARQQAAKGEREKSRKMLMACSTCCLLGTFVLIWSTGGAQSVFTPLFVMTYTLTLSKAKKSNAPQIIFICFLVALLGAIWLGKYKPIMPKTVLDFILISPFQYISYSLGLIAAIVVPFGSQIWVRKNEKQRQILSQSTLA